MLALYRSGRQTEALTVYRATREALVEEFGIEPTPSLRLLERAILTQDRVAGPRRARSGGDGPAAAPVLVLPSEERAVDPLLGLAAPLARVHARELIVARLLADGDDVAAASAALNARRESLDLDVRTAAFTTGCMGRRRRPAGVDGRRRARPPRRAIERRRGSAAGRASRAARTLGRGRRTARGPGARLDARRGSLRSVRRRCARLGGARARRLARRRDGSAAPARRDEGGREPGPAGCEPAARRCGARRPARRRRPLGAAARRAERRRARRSRRAGDGRRARRLTAMAAGRHRCGQAVTRAQRAARRRCSCTAGRVLEVSHRARAARASPGRSSSRSRRVRSRRSR